MDAFWGRECRMQILFFCFHPLQLWQSIPSHLHKNSRLTNIFKFFIPLIAVLNYGLRDRIPIDPSLIWGRVMASIFSDGNLNSFYNKTREKWSWTRSFEWALIIHFLILRIQRGRGGEMEHIHILQIKSALLGWKGQSSRYFTEIR